jgi:hypothetical protein
MYLIIFSAGLIIGLISSLILIRYGIGLGTRIVYRTKENLPVFGKDEMPVEQTHTGSYDEVENEE